MTRTIGLCPNMRRSLKLRSIDINRWILCHPAVNPGHSLSAGFEHTIYTLGLGSSSETLYTYPRFGRFFGIA